LENLLQNLLLVGKDFIKNAEFSVEKTPILAKFGSKK